MNRLLNASTQPFRTMPVFNAWDVVAKGWYLALASDLLGFSSPEHVRVCGQSLAFFRDAEGVAHASEAHVAGAAPLKSFAVDEKYGFIWVYPDAEAPTPVVGFAGWHETDVVSMAGISYERPCHHHVSMINGIDPQHLRTVHEIHMDMDLEVVEGSDGRVVDYTLKGQIPDTTLRERVMRLMLGERYQYSMRYADGTIGLLSVNQGTRLFGVGPELPSTHMIFAYVPIEPGRTLVQPIYVARRRKGLFGALFTRALLTAMRWGFYVLRDEDGMIYDNIRFHPTNLLPLDRPIAKFIAYVNRLEPSAWSTR